jgi:hypothetical protein
MFSSMRQLFLFFVSAVSLANSPFSPLMAGPPDQEFFDRYATLLRAQSQLQVDQRRSQTEAVTELLKAGAQADLMRSQAQLNHSAARAQWMISEKLKQQADWQELEVKEIRRLTRTRQREEAKLRADVDSLVRESKHLVSFFNGLISPQTLQAFQRAIAKFAMPKQVGQYLAASVPTLPTEEFTSDRQMFAVLDPDGSLKPAPPAVGRNAQEHSVEQARRQFVQSWDELLMSARYANRISPAQLANLEALLEAWEKAVHEESGEDGQMPRSQRSSSRLYFADLDRLVRAFESSDNTLSLFTELAARRGYYFAGGTCGELLEHMEKYALSVRPGSQAQQVLGELGDELGEQLLKAVDDEIQAQVTAIDHVQQQSPAKAPAVREAIVSGVTDKVPLPK